MKKVFIPLSVVLFFLVQSISAQEWNVRNHIPLDNFIVQSHRGAGNLSPENSIEAFEIAWQLSTIPEADLRLTKDGVIVAFHDNNFERILPDASEKMKKKGIQDLPLSEVRKLDIGAWKSSDHSGQRVPTLAEITDILRKNPSRKIYIDIKNVDFLQLANETKKVHSQLILASTNYNEILLWKRLAPNSQTLHWMGGSEDQLGTRLSRLEAHGFDSIDQLQIHVRTDINGNFSPSASFLERTGKRLRKYGVLFQVLPWESASKTGGSNPEIYWRLMDLGAASFATDFPDTATNSIREYYQQKR